MSKCADDLNPDYWFPELKKSNIKAQLPELYRTTVYAISRCVQCPIRQECFNEGMEERNLPYGIWGGVIAGDRLKLLGHKQDSFPEYSPEYRAMKLSALLIEYRKEQNEKTDSTGTSNIIPLRPNSRTSTRVSTRS